MFDHAVIKETIPSRLRMFGATASSRREGEEYKLPKTSSMVIILTANMLLQVCLTLDS